jgi:hypothetical protein
LNGTALRGIIFLGFDDDDEQQLAERTGRKRETCYSFAVVEWMNKMGGFGMGAMETVFICGQEKSVMEGCSGYQIVWPC